MKKKLIFIVIVVLIVVVSIICNIEKKWNEEKLEKSIFNNRSFENYITAEVISKNINAKDRKIEILLTKTDKKELRHFDTYMILEVYLSSEWYVVPLLLENYMLEMPVYFEGESTVQWLDFRSFNMRPGRYRVLVPYYIEGNKTKYYAPAEFTCK